MKTRVISGVFIVIALVSTLLIGGPFMGLVLLAISMIAYYELMKAIGVHTEGKKVNAIEATGYTSIIVLYVLTYFDLIGRYFDLWLVITFMVFLAIYVFSFPKINASAIMGAFFSIIYAPYMFSFIYRIRVLGDGNGEWLCGIIFVAAWMSDTCAYFVGSAIGKHKLAPVLSPKKSIEGSIGGIVGAALSGAFYGWILSAFSVWGKEYILICTVTCAVGGVVSQIGDLAASGIKRQHNIKDYGKLIPGHGGIMDRFDSIIVTVPMVYFLIKLFL